MDERHRGQSAEGYGGDAGEVSAPRDHAAWQYATLWSGGFPCQDLSVAGKRRGLAGARSGLAFAFLDLVERHRPPAILLENVPGLLSSHRGRDFGALLDRLAQLGYWWAYRILDARHFGVPQRRRRVFIVALHAERGFGADSAAAVLSVGARCGRHPAAGHQTGAGVAGGAVPGVAPSIRAGGHGDPGIGRDNDWQRLAYAIKTTEGKQSGSPERSDRTLVLSASPDPGGVRAPDGLAGGVDDLAPTLLAPDARHRIEGGKRQDGSRTDRIPVTLAPTLRVGPQRPQDGGPGDTVPITVAFDRYNGIESDLSPTLPSSFEGGFNHVYARTVQAPQVGVADGRARSEAEFLHQVRESEALLPLGLDSHRYRCCGNGVVSSVSEWVGWRLREAVGTRDAA